MNPVAHSMIGRANTIGTGVVVRVCPGGDENEAYDDGAVREVRDGQKGRQEGTGRDQCKARESCQENHIQETEQVNG